MKALDKTTLVNVKKADAAAHPEASIFVKISYSAPLVSSLAEQSCNQKSSSARTLTISARLDTLV